MLEIEGLSLPSPSLDPPDLLTLQSKLNFGRNLKTATNRFMAGGEVFLGPVRLLADSREERGSPV